MIEFHLNGKEYIQLNDLLKWAKLVSTGGEANIRIVEGEVIVNGIVETRKRHKLREGFVVLFDSTEIVIK
ncbi:MAG: RNA-binding S4 domain-containing protein [Bacteroidota bacterium]|nr:RNA-binding S4 domain-containing protein [Bacteroidota bacterium]